MNKQGKSKTILMSESPDTIYLEFRDDITAYNKEKEEVIAGKGALNCEISTEIFKYLESKGVKTHFIETPVPGLMEVVALGMIPVEVVVRNIAAGSICRQTWLSEGHKFERPLIEFYLKDDDLGDPLIPYTRLLHLGIVSDDHILTLLTMAGFINELLLEYFEMMDLTLVDFKLEFGVDEFDNLYLADEISPDSCRIWDNGYSLDKDLFRKFGPNNVIAAYSEVLRRIGEVKND